MRGRASRRFQNEFSLTVVWKIRDDLINHRSRSYRYVRVQIPAKYERRERATHNHVQVPDEEDGAAVVKDDGHQGPVGVSLRSKARVDRVPVEI